MAHVPIIIENILFFFEEERLEDIRIENIERRIMREASDPFSIEDVQFVELFRLNKDMTQFVLNGLIPQLNDDSNHVAIPVIIKFFGVLQFYATGTYQRVIGQGFRAINEVTNAIVNSFSEQWVRFPRTAEEKYQIQQRFMEARGFPGVIGAVDCTHVEILKPNIEEHNYINRKGYHSKNIQIVCDHDLKILNINARYAGATHDSYIWRHSAVRNMLEDCYNRGDSNSWLLGDSGYPQEPWLMTPIENALPGTPESSYTESHIQTRNCVERCIGVLKGRFLCLSKILRYSPEKVGNIVNACEILHNTCVAARLNLDLEVAPQNFEDINDQALIFVDPQANRNGNLRRRNLIPRYFAI